MKNDDTTDHAGQGKLQRASHAFRMELNARLHNGCLGPELLPWINETAEIMHICADHFDGVAVSAKNLSDYRTGVYRKWLGAQQLQEKQKSRAALALELARASGGHLSNATAQLIAGQYLDAFSAAAESEDAELPDSKAAMAVVALRKADQEEDKSRQRERLLQLKQQENDRRDREVNLREEDWAWKTAGVLTKTVEEKLEELRTAVESTADTEQRQMNVARVIFGDDLLARIKARREEAQAQ